MIFFFFLEDLLCRLYVLVKLKNEGRVHLSLVLGVAVVAAGGWRVLRSAGRGLPAASKVLTGHFSLGAPLPLGPPDPSFSS